MKYLALALAATALAFSVEISRGQEAKPAVKITPEGVWVHPYTANRPDTLIDPKAKDTFDELRCTVTETKGKLRIRISGKMKEESGKFEGSPVLHLGKLALVRISEQSGSIEVRKPAIYGVTRYFIAYERNDTKIVPEELKLEKGGDYTWSVKKEDGNFVFTVFLKGEKVNSLSAPEKEVRSFGVAAITRFHGDEADMSLLID
jgi:hypothetical protein